MCGIFFRSFTRRIRKPGMTALFFLIIVPAWLDEVAVCNLARTVKVD
jgi:hypothetical protein